LGIRFDREPRILLGPATGVATPMSSLDEELARAVAESEDASDAPAVAADPVAGPGEGVQPRSGRPARSLGLLAALLVIGGGILTLVLTSFEDSAVYSKGVDELVAERTKLAERNVRVEGTLVKGSLKRRDEPCEYRFKLQKNGATVDVHYPQCIVPDTFRDVPGVDVAVTAEGKLDELGHFSAHTIMAKCPSKYEMNEAAAKGQAAPHSTITAPAYAN
jgi:cytochrome c-type biogenesis protein CcmE